MEFFCYHRDRPGSGALRDELLEAHWTYMDHYEKELIARGPTFADDDTATGSVHIVDLPDAAAARAFAFDEPITRPVSTVTCWCGGGATCWAAPCGSSRAAERAATATWCWAWARARPRIPSGRPRGTGRLRPAALRRRR